MTEDVIVEDAASEAETDVKVDVVQDQEPESNDETEAGESPEGEEVEQEEETVEQRLERLEQEREGLKKKNDRQVAAYKRLQEAHERLRQERQQAANKPQAETKEPNIDDFETYQDYIDAYSDWKADQKISKKEAENRERQQRERMQQIAEERAKIAQEQETEYLKSNPRYKASKGEFESYVTTAKFDPQVEAAFVQQAYKGNVPQLINYFGENNGEKIEELEKISRMDPIDAAIEVYKIQQKLVTPKKEDKKPLPKPVKAAPATKVTKDLSSGSVLRNLGLKK